MTEKEFLDYLQTRQNLFLYGAGTVAKRVLRFCVAHNVSVKGILVSEMAQNPKEIKSIPVYELGTITEHGIKSEDIDLLVAVSVKPYGGTCSWNDDLFDIPFRSRFVLPAKTSEWLRKQDELQCLREVSDGLLDSVVCMEDENVEPNHSTLVDLKSNTKFCRCETEELIQSIEIFKVQCDISTLFDAYGSFSYLPCEKELSQKDTDSYVVLSHFDKADVSEKSLEQYIPLQVGATLTDVRKGCQTDATGINISQKNRDYSECTGIYWIWKNTSGQDYVGINHYRRRLMFDEDNLKEIKRQGIDVTLSLPHFCVTTVREFFMRFVSKKDWELMTNAILLNHSERIELWEKYENGHFYFHGNLALWKREWFDKYCEFAFGIAEQIEAEYEKRGIIRQDRYMGFLFENLTSFFVMMHKDEMNIACTQMKWMA